MNVALRLTRSAKARFNRFLIRHLHCKHVPIRLERAMVSFTFDDFPRSAYQVGGRMLVQRGWRGTYYTSLQLAGQGGLLEEHFSMDDLQSLVRDGHELACHTYRHLAAKACSVKDYVEDVEDNATRLAEMMPGQRFHSFAFPMGAANPEIKRLLSRRFSSLRSTIQGLHVGKVDLNLLMSNPLYSGHVSIEQVNRLVEHNQRVKGWLIFYTHDVTDKPSRFGCTPEYFAQVLHCVSQANSQVMPVCEVVNPLLR